MPFDAVAIDTTGDDVADEDIVMILRGKILPGVVCDAADRRGSVEVAHQLRDETKTVVRLAEARVPAAADDLIGRLGVAVGRVLIAQGIERATEGVDLAVGVLLDA